MKDKKAMNYVFRILVASILVLAMYIVQWKALLDGFPAGVCLGIAIIACGYSVYCTFKLASVTNALKKELAEKNKLLAENTDKNEEHK